MGEPASEAPAVAINAAALERARASRRAGSARLGSGLLAASPSPAPASAPTPEAGAERAPRVSDWWSVDLPDEGGEDDGAAHDEHDSLGV